MLAVVSGALLDQFCKKNDRYFVAPDATAKGVIQIKRDGLNTVVKSFENFNFLVSSRLIGDSTLQIVMSDTGYRMLKIKLDTVNVKVN